jgi:hypothetical protein
MESKNITTEIIGILEALFTEEITLVENDLEALESLVNEKIRLLGQGLLQRLVNRGPNGYYGSSIRCRCGNAMRFVSHRRRDIHTLLGWISLRRAYYHCQACGWSVCPYDQSSGLGAEQLSPALAKACCLLATDDSFQLSGDKVRELFGQTVSERTIERLVHHVGSVVLDQQDAQIENVLSQRQVPQAHVTPERLYITADGTTVCEHDGWHEAKVGCLYWENQRFHRQARYVGSFENSERFGWQLWFHACQCGLREAKEVVYIGDGARWIRNEQQKHFAKATCILDWYHASEHIWDCGKLLLGEAREATDQWVRENLDLLWDGRTRELLNALHQHRKRYRGPKRQALDDLIRYILTNEDQMRYDVFRSKGYDIGSGAVEAACKHVVGKRLKQSGMRWSRVGSSTTLALRIVWLNGDWKKLWSEKPLAA